MMKEPRKILTNRSARISRSKATINKAGRTPDNDGDISLPIQAIIDAAKHSTIGDNPEESKEELTEQQKADIAKKERIRLKQIEEVIIASTQKTRNALDKTLQEVMTGVEVKEGKE